MSSRGRVSGTWAAVLLILFSGCLPYSCRREESTALMPADSTSRQIATGAPTDTLDLLWTADERMDYPRTVRFGPSGSSLVHVSDAERGAVLSFGENGHLTGEITGLSIPFLAGVRGDTIAAFSPEEAAIHLLVDNRIATSVAIDDPDRSNSALLYAAFGDALYYKRVGAEEAGFIGRVNRSGDLVEREPLPGPQWRHAGLLRTWGDTLISLSGYRPVVDVLTPGEPLDTLALQGFDSPMLARSRAFLLGEADEPPLLTSSAAPAGDRLFVLNMRAGWLQIDVFDRQGRLQHLLVERDPVYQRSFFPQDIDVHRTSDGTYRIAVVLSQPSPQLRLYAWASP